MFFKKLFNSKFYILNSTFLCSLLLSSCGLFEMPDRGRIGTARPGVPAAPGSIGDAIISEEVMHRRSFGDLPGWQNDDHRYALQAFRYSCSTTLRPSGRVQPDPELFAQACRNLPSGNPSPDEARRWFERHFEPFQIIDNTQGRHTGYFSPVVRACRTQTDWCSVPVLDRPADGREIVGVDSTRIVNERIGTIIAWIHPIDLQDMGSATLVFEDGGELRLSVATTNQLPFNGIGAQLVARGIRPAEGMGMKAVREFLKQPENAALAAELVANNPRYVFYTPQRTDRVVGRMGVPLSRIRSIAVDENIYTMGLPFWLDTTLSKTNQPFRRLMIGQDTGGAILGYNRTDIYFGKGDFDSVVYAYAQGQNTTGQLFILLPKAAR